MKSPKAKSSLFDPVGSTKTETLLAEIAASLKRIEKHLAPQAQESEVPTLSVDEAHQMMGGDEAVSRGLFYKSIASGEVPSFKLGKRILIPRQKFEAWMKGNHA